MEALRRRTASLFGEDSRLFLLALDHAQTGVVPGLERTGQLLESLAASPLDGFILNVGLAGLMAGPPLLRKKLILRSSFGGSSLAATWADTHRNHVSPETALSLGADAVLMMVVMGGDDYRNLQTAAADIDAYHRLGIPVVAEVLAADFSKTQSFETQYHGARVAAELGADVVKAFYVEGFGKVTAACPAPVILAGGPKGKDILEIAAKALEEGARGFAFGRNIFQDPDPAACIHRIASLLDRT
jgi:DhnA family fructose-bisphosphate aldolase class Ia